MGVFLTYAPNESGALVHVDDVAKVARQFGKGNTGLNIPICQSTYGWFSRQHD